jgi:hypothetical protein
MFLTAHQHKHRLPGSEILKEIGDKPKILKLWFDTWHLEVEERDSGVAVQPGEICDTRQNDCVEVDVENEGMVCDRYDMVV